MPATYTTSLRLVKPATGDTGWGTTVNGGLTDLVDFSVAGTASITMTAADYTLSNNNGATDEARAMVLNLAGSPGAARNVICPAVSKVYIVYNNTTGGYAQTVKTASGTGVSVRNGTTAILRCDGTNVVSIITFDALSPITSEGDLIVGSGAYAATRLAIGANGYILTSNGTTATWTAPTPATAPGLVRAIAINCILC